MYPIRADPPRSCRSRRRCCNSNIWSRTARTSAYLRSPGSRSILECLLEGERGSFFRQPINRPVFLSCFLFSFFSRRISNLMKTEKKTGKKSPKMFSRTPARRTRIFILGLEKSIIFSCSNVVFTFCRSNIPKFSEHTCLPIGCH